MEERGNFYNDGSGWTCRPCKSELSVEVSISDKNPAIEGHARVKWTDAARRFLSCPRCGIIEPFELE